MNSSHVIDPVFSVVAEPLARAGRARAFFPEAAKAARRRPAFALLRGPACSVLRVFERLRLCGAPRIVSAECFLPEAAPAPAKGGRA